MATATEHKSEKPPADAVVVGRIGPAAEVGIGGEVPVSAGWSAPMHELVTAIAALKRRVELLEQTLERTPLPVTGVLGRLSATEHAIAERVVAGRTNEQIARDLHYSPKTIEWTLSKVYRKLHVRSRTELAVKLAREERAVATAV